MKRAKDRWNIGCRVGAWVAVSGLLAAILATFSSGLAAEAGDTVLLVAKRQLQHPLYGASILIAKPIGNGQHIGFILNKPTSVKLRDALPADESSRKVHDPLYLGGPFYVNNIFALVNRADSPGRGSIEIVDHIHLAIDTDTVKRVIAVEPESARFFFGAVLWRPGELDSELERGLWHVREPELEVVLRKQTQGLWEDLVRRAEQEAYLRSHGI